jgi:hypothetical protein
MISPARGDKKKSLATKIFFSFFSSFFLEISRYFELGFLATN